MKKRWIRLLSILMTATVVMSSAVEVAATVESPADATATDSAEVMRISEEQADVPAADGTDAGESVTETVTTPATDSSTGSTDGSVGTNGGVAGSNAENVTGSTGTSGTTSDNTTGSTGTGGTASDSATGSTGTGSATSGTAAESTGTDSNASENSTGEASEDISGTVSVENEDISGTVTVETDKNDDNVEIKKNDRPYLALGADLTPEQQASVLAMMGIDAGRLAEYDVVYVNNSEEHQYLGSYIDSSKIGTKSLSSVVIVEREDGNGINISTNNISYCTVGMYKNALATAGIENADIIVAGPSPMSGTAALVGVFKAYKEMTGEEVDEENIDAALNELVVTGALKASGADSDEVEGMIAYVKQAVVEHDLSNETEIRKVIAEACEKFDLTMTEEEITEVVKLMQKISELDLDVDSLLNSAQTIYEKISTADSGFWAKIRELLMTIIEKIKELF